jgi:hypothetical protein
LAIFSKLKFLKGQDMLFLIFHNCQESSKKLIKEVVKNLGKFPKVHKRKGFHYCLPSEIQMFSNLKIFKTEVVERINLLLQARPIFWQSLVKGKKQMPY